MSQVSGQIVSSAIPFLKIGLALGGGYAARGLVGLAFERASDRRFHFGADGVADGAGGIWLEAGRDAVLLLHGFGDTPQSLAFLAHFLHSHGWSVYAPLLPGHGRSLSAFRLSGADGWLAGARAAWERLEGCGGRLALLGQSMGGALAALLVAEGARPGALVLLAPYLFPPRTVQLLAKGNWLLRVCTPYIPSLGGASIKDLEARVQSLGHRVTPVRLIPQLCRLASAARQTLSEITVPTLLIQSPHDNRLPKEAALRTLALLGTVDKRLLWVGGGHVVSADIARQAVARATLDWLVQHLSGESEAVSRR
jgi:carboxylesterase